MKKKDQKNAKTRLTDKKQRELEAAQLRHVAFYSSFAQGEGPKKTDNQDSFTIIDSNPDIFYFFGVFDGHGSSGKEASNAACDNFQQYFEKNLDKVKKLNTQAQRDDFLIELFRNSEKKLKTSGIDYSNSGTCSITCFIQQNN